MPACCRFLSTRTDRRRFPRRRTRTLKLIAARSTGADHIDARRLPGARRSTVANVPSYGEHTVAEHTFALILTLSRRLREVIGNARPDRPRCLRGGARVRVARQDAWE